MKSLTQSRSLLDRSIKIVFLFCILFWVLMGLGITSLLVFETASFFSDISFFDVFGRLEWNPANQSYGVWPLIFGTLITTLIACLVAIPAGIIGAIFLSEFAPRKMRRILKPILVTLAAIPTVVYGYFALILVTPWIQRFFPGLSGFNALSPGIVLGIMILPMLTSHIDDAIYSVPVRLRESSLALGATRLRTIFKVVVPSSVSGVILAILLSISRVFGETMVVSIAAGTRPYLGWDVSVPIQTMTSYIATEGSYAVADSFSYRAMFPVATLLILITLLFNGMVFFLKRHMKPSLDR